MFLIKRYRKIQKLISISSFAQTCNYSFFLFFVLFGEVKDTDFYELNELNIWEVSHHAPGMLPGKKRAGGPQTADEKSRLLQNKNKKKKSNNNTQVQE